MEACKGYWQDYPFYVDADGTANSTQSVYVIDCGNGYGGEGGAGGWGSGNSSSGGDNPSPGTGGGTGSHNFSSQSQSNQNEAKENPLFCDDSVEDCFPFPGEEEQIDMEELADCHQEIINDLIGNTQFEFRRIFEKFNGNQPVPENYNVKFQYGDCGGGATGCADLHLKNGWAIVTINPDVNQNATDLSFARTILHETLHAYLLFETEYPSDCDLNCLLNKYISKHGPDPNDVHYNLYVETKFLNDIATELRNYAAGVGYNVNTLGDQFFKDMAWGGLFETDVFETLPLSDRNRIKNRIGAELYNQNYYGTLPRGIKACE